MSFNTTHGPVGDTRRLRVNDGVTFPASIMANTIDPHAAKREAVEFAEWVHAYAERRMEESLVEPELETAPALLHGVRFAQPRHEQDARADRICALLDEQRLNAEDADAIVARLTYSDG